MGPAGRSARVRRGGRRRAARWELPVIYDLAHININCTDLERDPYIQGRGMPNLVKMLLNT